VSKPSRLDPWRPMAGQGRPKAGPEHSRGYPETTRGGPRPPQGSPWAPRSRPREPQSSPEGTPERPKVPPRLENRRENVPKIDSEADFGRKAESQPISERFSTDFSSKLLEIDSEIELQIEGEFRKNISSKRPSINPAISQKSMFSLRKTLLFVMRAEKQFARKSR